MSGAIEIISSRFGIYHAVLNSSLIITFSDSTIHDYLGLKESAGEELITDFFPELVGLENDLLEVLNRKRDRLTLNAINRTAAGEIFFNLHVFSDYKNDNSAYVIIEDITEGSLSLRMVQQKRNEMILRNNELIRREEFITTLLNTIPDPVFYKDASGRYIGCNSEFEKFTGYSKTDFCGKSPGSIFSVSDENSYDRYDRALISRGGSIHYDAEIENRAGEKLYVIINKSVFPDSEYGGVVIVGVITDITSRIKMEEQLRVSREELKDRIDVMQKNLSIARGAVDALLQKDFPQSNLFDMECSYLPLDQIGGDFYSAIQSENGLNIFIGDISGHGVAAALFLSLLKYFSESIIREYGYSPGRCLEELNFIYWNKIISSYFFTAVAGIFSFENGIKFTFSNGGHPHPVLMKAGGEIFFIGDNDTVVGIFESQKFQEFETVIEEGDMLFFYTDGIPETHNSSDKIIGYDETLLKLFSECRRETLKETIDAIIKQVIDFRGDTKQEDDILLLGFHAV